MGLVMYECEHFKIQELVPKSFYDNFPEWKLWMLFDNRMLYTIDRMRDVYGSCTINNWLWHGNLDYCGFRPINIDVQTEKSSLDINNFSLSQHCFGRAFDLHFSRYTAQQVNSDIVKNLWAEEFKYITRIEERVSWNHIDCGNHDKENLGIYVFRP